ncbi:MAG: hypothetical protein K2M04_01275 [Muribaculaceae bacterium]|nr:hypothetical protein [Muribaculaceae bacterium]
MDIDNSVVEQFDGIFDPFDKNKPVKLVIIVVLWLPGYVIFSFLSMLTAR